MGNGIDDHMYNLFNSIYYSSLLKGLFSLLRGYTQLINNQPRVRIANLTVIIKIGNVLK